MSAGYSGTPFVKKNLVLQKVHIPPLYNHPYNYFDLFSDLPEDITLIKEVEKEKVDFINLFCTTFEEFKETTNHYKKALKMNGMLWVSWPKKGRQAFQQA